MSRSAAGSLAKSAALGQGASMMLAGTGTAAAPPEQGR